MRTDDYLYGDIDPKYKEMQKELASYKIMMAKKKVNELCSVTPVDRELSQICEIREAIEFWERSDYW